MRLKTVALICSLLVFLSVLGCDRGLLSLAPNNFVWSERSTDIYDARVNAYYAGDNRGQYWVALHWAGRKPTYAIDDVVLLCLKESAKGCSSSLELQSGLAIRTEGMKIYLEENARITSLEADSLTGQSRSGKLILAYNGRVICRPTLDQRDTTWLRFNVHAKRNREKLMPLVERLSPLLAKEPSAGGVLDCFAALAETQSK
jgi:hypothetical protein